MLHSWYDQPAWAAAQLFLWLRSYKPSARLMVPACLRSAPALLATQCIRDGEYGCSKDSHCCTTDYLCNGGFCQ